VSKIYLASTSPRRQALLRQLEIGFDVIAPEVAEQRLPGESASTYVGRMAVEKARQVSWLVQQRRLPPRPVLAADTCILLGQEILGKPCDRVHGETMLRRLSGREHTVLTAVAIVRADRCIRCGACVVQCPQDALAFAAPDGRRIEPETIRRYKLNLLGRRAVRPSEVGTEGAAKLG